MQFTFTILSSGYLTVIQRKILGSHMNFCVAQLNICNSFHFVISSPKVVWVFFPLSFHHDNKNVIAILLFCLRKTKIQLDSSFYHIEMYYRVIKMLFFSQKLLAGLRFFMTD